MARNPQTRWIAAVAALVVFLLAAWLFGSALALTDGERTVLRVGLVVLGIVAAVALFWYLRPVDAPVVVTWSAKRSDEDCTKWTTWAMPGFYHVQAAALGGDATDVQFQLTGGVPAVVTTTADPQTQGGKGKKNNGGDTAHTPGEDGAGNSAG